jgi:RNA recognition motif-containing protein
MNKFAKNTLSKSDGVTTIYVGNLKFSKAEGDVKKMFQKYGKVTYVKNIMDEKTGKAKGFSFIQMPNSKEALKAIKFLNGKQVDGRTLKVSIALDNEAPKALGPKKPKVNIQEKEEKVIKKRKKKGLAVLFDYLDK